MKIWKRYIILALICALLGVITGSLFKGSYYDELKRMFDIFFEDIRSRLTYLTESDRVYLLLDIVQKRIKALIILWLLSGLPIVRLYIAWIWGYIGYIGGFLSCFMFMAYKGQAAVILVLWGMPHIILYGIAYIVAMYYIVNEFRRKKAAVIVATLLLLILGCVCEAYVNPMMLGRYAIA